VAEKQAHKPPTGLTRWLARQVGPTTPIACPLRPAKVRSSCSPGDSSKVSGDALSGLSASRLAPFGGDGATTPPAAAPRASATASATTAPKPLALIRSFEIPVGDPSYERLLNLSYTYDSALAATAFVTEGLGDQAGRLLDQLAALQKEGSIELAYNVATGQGSGNVSSGSLAFSAIAFNAFDTTYRKTTYLANARAAVDYLLNLRESLGLVRGGPAVKWVSTQHNILTVFAIDGLVRTLEDHGEKTLAKHYAEAATSISKAIETQLVVRTSGVPAHFREGVADEVVPLDAQTLGAMFALSRFNYTLGLETYSYTQLNFALSGRTIELSKVPATYNMTYSSKGPFSGYRPYIGTGARDVLWFEGTAEMRLVSGLLGQRTDTLDASVTSWWNVTRKEGVGPLGADRTITESKYNEYHVWPTAAAGSWTILSSSPSTVSQIL
jgi:outer membrane protein W